MPLSSSRDTSASISAAAVGSEHTKEEGADRQLGHLCRGPEQNPFADRPPLISGGRLCRRKFVRGRSGGHPDAVIG